jgi:WD40 repeat protein/serine/threonine protein kinase
MANHLDRIGQQVEDYRLLRWLGGGGFGEVYLAEQVRDHSQVAIKLLGIQLSRNEELKAFINEARTIRLKHAHIVPLLDFGIGRGELPFLVMEYAPAGTLRDRHPRGTQVSFPLVVNYAQQVASALQYAHEQRLIHRDVKPQNMLLREDGTVLLSDFGLVAVMHDSDSLSPHQQTVGTLAYIAPEQFQGQAQAESDQYSLAVVVYEWIAGRRPFEGTVPEIIMQQMMKPPPSLRAQVPGLSSAVEEVILKALAKDPKDRFVSVQAFAMALEEAIQDISVISDEHKISPIDYDKQILPSSRQKSDPSPPAPGPRVDWGEAQVIPTFYGREQEMVLLTQWIVQERCRVVSVLGLGGIGKSALAVSIMHRISEHFEVVIFRSLRDAPAFETLLDDCLQILSPQPLRILPSTLEQRLNLLLEQLRKVRVLIVLDNLECLLREGNVRGDLRPGFEGYGQLLRRVAQTAHQSCLLCTSREKPAELRLLAGKYSSVRTLRLGGLSVTACQQLLQEKALVGTQFEQEHLIQAYAGNPLALKIVAETIVDLFGGEIGPFLASGTVLFGSINDLLEEHFARLSPLEQSTLCWLAIMRESVTLQELLALLVTPLPHHRVLLEAVDSLHRRSLIERGKRAGSFTLQSVVLEYVTAHLVAEACREIKQGRLDRLIQYGLCQAQAKEYVRQTQERLLLLPVLVDLQSAYPRREEVEQRLLSLLDELRGQADEAVGYGPANVIALLGVQRRHLRALDLSHLSIRSAYLQGIEMQDTNLAGALIQNTTFTEPLDALLAVAISPRGTWWAAGSRRGEVRVWNGESQTLHHLFQAHTDIVFTLAFSPDERFLASGSWDGTVKLWNMTSGGASPPGALLWMGEHANVMSVAFSPDGKTIASGGRDTSVKLWDSISGTALQSLYHPGYVYAVAFSPDGKTLATGDASGAVRLWLVENTPPSICIQTFEGHTNWVMGLAFSPDGRTLASGSWDHTIKLWDLESHHLLQTLYGHTNNVHGLAFSPDGRLLSSCSVDQTIRIFDVDPLQIRSVLREHTAAVYDLCFTPDGSRLLSGSEDGTLRLWEVQRGRCIRVIAGYAVSFYNIDWSPESTHLVSGGTDGVVTIWDTTGDTPPRVLVSHSWIIWGVGWSPDGKFLAESSHPVISLWDSTSGECRQKLRPSVASAMGVAWSPDGKLLAAATLMHGVQVWDVRTGSLRWPERMHEVVLRYVVWSPDGRRLAAGGDEGSVYVWDATNGEQEFQLSGHHGIVMRVAWNPDGTLLASCGGGPGNGELFIWDIRADRADAAGACFDHDAVPVQSFVGHPGVVNALVWSPGGDRLITGDCDGKLRWWDKQSGECVCIQEAHHAAIQSLRGSPDGRRIASCGYDGAIRIWNLQTGEHVRTLRRDRPYERLNITGIRGLGAAQIASLRALGAMECDSL